MASIMKLVGILPRGKEFIKNHDTKKRAEESIKRLQVRTEAG